VAASLAHIHLDLLTVHEELAEIAQEEPPAAASFVEIALASERQGFIAADTVKALRFSDTPSVSRAGQELTWQLTV
jgi:hypothetical protein